MKTPPVIIADYYRKHALLPDETIECMEYTLKSIYNELSKFVIYLAFFTLIHLTEVYLITYCTFVSLRTFAGGVHCKTYWQCFTLSFILISGTIILACSCRTTLVLWILSLSSTVFPAVLAPVTPSFRIIKTPQNMWVLKLIATGLTLVWIGIAYCFRNNTPVTNAILLSIIVTNYQLIIPKWIIKLKTARR